MPTPFMHLAATHRLLHDDALPAAIRQTLTNPKHLGAYLLGNVAPDARVSGGLKREDTHFFEYAAKIDPHPYAAMMKKHPALQTATGAQQAFVCGYLAHLAMDVVWAEDMLFPLFYAQTHWADPTTRYIMLHVLLSLLDERDYQQWDAAYNSALAKAKPRHWVPFLRDDDLAAWRDLIARQITTPDSSETVAVLGARIPIGAQGLRALMDDTERLETELYAYVPQASIAAIEENMYRAMINQVLAYMSGDRT